MQKIVISLGGSLIVPPNGIDIRFLKEFNSFIRKEIAKGGMRFFVVVGGGQTARDYRDAGREVVQKELTSEDLDWLGIHATRLNAHLMRTIFRDIAHPVILERFDIIRKVSEPLVVAAGWKPGWSTDFCAAMVCDDYNVKTIINLSNIEKVFTKDPKKYSDARPIDKITWSEFRKIVGDRWDPGMNVPFDPIAAKKAEALGLTAVIMKGDMKNLKNYMEKKEFTGTVIYPDSQD